MPINDEDRENLVAFLDGELDEETSRSLEARMNTEPELRAELEELKQAWEMLDYLPRPEPTATFTHRTVQRLDAYRPVSTMTMPQPERTRRWLVGAVWVAGLLVAGVAGVGIARYLFPPLPPGSNDARLNRALVKDLRVIENKPLYDNIDDVDFLKKLNNPELFGKETY